MRWRNAARRRVRAARAHAISALETELRHQPAAEVVEILGVPSLGDAIRLRNARPQPLELKRLATEALALRSPFGDRSVVVTPGRISPIPSTLRRLYDRLFVDVDA